MMNKLPPQIVAGAKRPSFAFATASERWPKIVTGCVDKMHRSYNKVVTEQGQKAGDEVNSVIAKLSEMRYRMMTDKLLEPMDEQFPDAAIWNEEMRALSRANNDRPVSWYNGPWLFVECHMYRKMQEFHQQTQHLRTFDVFWEDKENGYKSCSKHLLAIGTELVHLLEKQLSIDDIKTALLRIIQISLWGNKCDLSLTGGDPHSMSSTIFHELDDLRPQILADDLEAAIDRHLLAPQGPLKQVDLVLDNAGLELFMDLCLADFLIAKGLATKCVFHGKGFPWFVSDTTRRDMEWMLDQLDADSDSFLNKLGTRWKNHYNQGTFEYRDHPFWTQSFEYCRMEEKAPDLYKQLRGSSFLFFKGDLNYRKLVSDRQWPVQTPFSEALCGFGPAPFLALRTLKAETVAGLSAAAVQKIRSKFAEDDTTWMVSSDYAVAQLFEPQK